MAGRQSGNDLGGIDRLSECRKDSHCFLLIIWACCGLKSPENFRSQPLNSLAFPTFWQGEVALLWISPLWHHKGHCDLSPPPPAHPPGSCLFCSLKMPFIVFFPQGAKPFFVGGCKHRAKYAVFWRCTVCLALFKAPECKIWLELLILYLQKLNLLPVFCEAALLQKG